MKSQQDLLLALSDSVLNMEDDLVSDIAQEYIAAGYPALDGILKGLVDGMQKASELYEKDEYFIPELLVCADAMYNGLAVLRPYLDQAEAGKKHKVVIGVVEGDTHDIGKNLVRILLESSGYETYDLGRDVPLQRFIDKAREVDASVIAISTLMSTTMPGMGKVIELLKAAGLKDRVKVIIGGAPISPAFARQIGADAYSPNAVEAVKVVHRLVAEEKQGDVLFASSSSRGAGGGRQNAAPTSSRGAQRCGDPFASNDSGLLRFARNDTVPFAPVSGYGCLLRKYSV